MNIEVSRFPASCIQPTYCKNMVSKFQGISYAQCEHFWSYGGKLMILARNCLQVLAKTFLSEGSSPCRIKTVVTHLKLFSIVGVPFSLVDLHSSLLKLFNSVILKDGEGITLGSLSVTTISADALDSISTFINSCRAVVSQNPIPFFPTWGIPLGFLMAGSGTVSRTIQIAKSLQLYQKISPREFSDIKYLNKDLIYKDLKKRLGIEEGISPSLSRKLPKDAIEVLQKLLSALENCTDTFFTDLEALEVLTSLKKIRNYLEKKMIVDIVGITANIIVIIALVFFSIGSANASPFLLMVLAFSLRLISLVYQDQKIK